MSKLRNKTTGDVISTSQFKGLYPNTSFPKVWLMHWDVRSMEVIIMVLSLMSGRELAH